MLKEDVIIIALKYEEPSWLQTWECINKCGCTVLIADRSGIGGMSKAYNDCFNQNIDIIKKYKYVWFVSNIVFDEYCLSKLYDAIKTGDFGAIHPAFDSDHEHIQPTFVNNVVNVRFIEWTAPIVSVDVYSKYQLDNQMPYWGMDLDWSYRVKSNNILVAVHQGTQVQHTYIRKNTDTHPITKIRKELRVLWDPSTERRIIKLYGIEWRDKLGYYGR